MKLESVLPAPESIDAVIRDSVENLPSPPVVAIKLLKLVGRNDVPAESLSKVIETDPATSAKVLRIVNSAHYGLRNKISSIRHAVVLLGFSEIRNLALEVSLFEQLTRQTGRLSFDRTFFWRHCLSTAKLARAIAVETSHPDPSEVYIAGLLHDVGKIISDVYGRITYSDFINHMSNSDEIMEEEERKLIGLGHDDIGAFFCAEWGLLDVESFANPDVWKDKNRADKYREFAKVFTDCTIWINGNANSFQETCYFAKIEDDNEPNLWGPVDGPGACWFPALRPPVLRDFHQPERPCRGFFPCVQNPE